MSSFEFKVVHFRNQINSTLKLHSHSHYDISYSSFSKCSSEYGAGFSILQGYLEGSHLSFQDCFSTDSFSYGVRNVGGGAFIFYGQSAFLSCVSISRCSNLKSEVEGIFILSNDQNDEKNSYLTSSHVSLSSCACSSSPLMVDRGNQEADKCNVSNTKLEVERVLHFGFQSFSCKARDLFAIGVTGVQIFYCSTKDSLDATLERSCFIDVSTRKAIISISGCNLGVKCCSFTRYTGQIGNVYIKGNIIFKNCEFSSPYNETWKTIDCKIGTELASIPFWNCRRLEITECSISRSELMFSILFYKYFV